MIEQTLREHIARSKESLNAIAKLTGIDYGTLYRFVNEKRKIQVHIVQRLCNHFGLELTYADSKIVAVLRRVAESLVVKSRREFKYGNGRLNQGTLHKYIISQGRLPTVALDENEREVAAYYDALALDRKGPLLEDALRGLAFSNTMTQISTKLLSEIDRDLQEFKEAYQQLDDDQKQLLRRGLSKAGEFQVEEYKLQGSHSFSIKVAVGHSHSDETRPQDENRVHLRPLLMQKAMSAWDDGKEFTPKDILEVV
jgi:DNA-binding phage protein